MNPDIRFAVKQSSAHIGTREEARAFYETHLARAHEINVNVGDRKVRKRIVFEAGGTHVFSEEDKAGVGIHPEDEVVRTIRRGRLPPCMERRKFSLDRARLMGEILPALSNFTVAIPQTGGRPGNEMRLVYGPRLEDGRYLCVVLRPGPGDARTVVSAYPVAQAVWMSARTMKRAIFP